MGNEVAIFTTNLDFPKGRMDVPVHKKVRENGVDIRFFPVQFSPWVYSRQLKKELKNHLWDFDIVHIHGLYRFPQTIAAHYARRYNVPYLVCPHGSLDPFLYNNPKNRFVKRAYEYLIELKNLNRASAIHFTSREEKELTRFLNLKAESIIIPNGILTEQYEALPPRGRFRKKHGLDGKKIVLHLGRINFKKGLDILVQSFALVAKRWDDVHLVIAGPDNEGYGEKVKWWLKEENIFDRATFTGMLLGEDKLAAFGDADIFVLPSYTENFGIAVVEAMTCELPVVISDKVNIWREVEEGGAGMVGPCDANRFAEMISKLVEDAEMAKQMGSNGKALVKKRFQLSSAAVSLEEAYRSILLERQAASD